MMQHSVRHLTQAPKTPAFEITEQPDNSSCGPTCLHAVYRYYGDSISLNQVIAETRKLPHGGSLAVFLGLHALNRGYKATIYTYNLQLFDPTWFKSHPTDLLTELQKQRLQKPGEEKLVMATEAYESFLRRGGQVVYADLTPSLLRMYLNAGTPILTGLSATYLHNTVRENPETSADDPYGGEPVGHFVVLYGTHDSDRKLLVADPYLHTPSRGSHYYQVSISRAICAILLGVLTYDANLLIIEPLEKR